MVVYLQDGPKDSDRGMSAVIDQRQMAFIPYVRVVTAGAKVRFSNSDPFPHNVFSPSGERFNLGVLNQGGSRTYSFDRPGAYTLLCNTHPNMLGFVFVSPSSYWAVTDAGGNFEIKDVPEGTYKVAAWGFKLAADAQTVDVKGGDLTVAFAMHR